MFERQDSLCDSVSSTMACMEPVAVCPRCGEKLLIYEAQTNGGAPYRGCPECFWREDDGPLSAPVSA